MSLSPTAGADGCPAQMGRRKKENSPFLCHFVLLGHSGKAVILPSLLIQIISGNALTDIPKIKCNLGTPQPVKLTGKINRHTFLASPSGHLEVSRPQVQNSSSIQLRSNATSPTIQVPLPKLSC